MKFKMSSTGEVRATKSSLPLNLYNTYKNSEYNLDNKSFNIKKEHTVTTKIKKAN